MRRANRLRRDNACHASIEGSGEGECYLVVGGGWGLLLAISGNDWWALEDPEQWGEPFMSGWRRRVAVRGVDWRRIQVPWRILELDIPVAKAGSR